MTSKEKALELFEKFTLETGNETFAKKCAIITVDEIDKSQPYNLYNNEDKKQYWLEVKQEIEILWE